MNARIVDPRDLAPLARALKERDRYVIVPHVNPDPDAIGSAVGLARLLSSLGKSAVVYVPEEIPPSCHAFQAHAPFTHVQPDWPDAQYVVVDCGTLKRLHPNAQIGQVFLNIDHHLDNEQFAEWIWADPQEPATAAMVAALARHMGGIDQWGAMALYAGIVYDTRAFANDTVRPETLRLGAWLMEQGANPAAIHRLLNENLSLGTMHMMLRALNQMGSTLGGRVLWAKVPMSLLAETGAHEEDTDLLISELLRIEGAQVVLVFRETPCGLIRTSLRGKGAVDVHHIAKSLGGGGHRNAAGARIPGPLDQVAQHVVDAVVRALEPIREARR